MRTINLISFSLLLLFASCGSDRTRGRSMEIVGAGVITPDPSIVYTFPHKDLVDAGSLDCNHLNKDGIDDVLSSIIATCTNDVSIAEEKKILKEYLEYLKLKGDIAVSYTHLTLPTKA